MQITEYGKELLRPWAERESRDVKNNTWAGTEKYLSELKTLKDVAGWCLLTYGNYALSTLNEWEQDGKATKAFDYEINDLRAELEKCISSKTLDPNLFSEFISGGYPELKDVASEVMDIIKNHPLAFDGKENQNISEKEMAEEMLTAWTWFSDMEEAREVLSWSGSAPEKETFYPLSDGKLLFCWRQPQKTPSLDAQIRAASTRATETFSSKITKTKVTEPEL